MKVSAIRFGEKNSWVHGELITQEITESDGTKTKYYSVVAKDTSCKVPCGVPSPIKIVPVDPDHIVYHTGMKANNGWNITTGNFIFSAAGGFTGYVYEKVTNGVMEFFVQWYAFSNKKGCYERAFCQRVSEIDVSNGYPEILGDDFYNLDLVKDILSK